MKRPSNISRKARRYHERAVRARRLTASAVAGTDRTAVERYTLELDKSAAELRGRGR
jgi:hypothetical protein